MGQIITKLQQIANLRNVPLIAGGVYVSDGSGNWSMSTISAIPSQAGNAGKFLTTDGTSTLSWSTPSAPTGATPTSFVGTSAIAGSATTFMRSDASPAISQSMIPTWSGIHTFSPTLNGSSGTKYGTVLSPNIGQIGTANFSALDINPNLISTGSTTNYLIDGRVNSGSSVFTVDTSGNITGTWAGAAIGSAYLPGSYSGFANPSGSIGLTTVNGSATTAMRSDASPALSVSIAPTWTSQHIFNAGLQVAAGQFVKSNEVTSLSGASLSLYSNLTSGGSGVKVPADQFLVSTNGAASTPPVLINGTIFTGGSGSTTWPQLLVQPSGTTSSSWNTNGTIYGANSPSGYAGNFLDLQANGTTLTKISAGGVLFNNFITATSSSTNLTIQNVGFGNSGNAVNMATGTATNASGTFVGVNVNPTMSTTSAGGWTGFLTNVLTSSDTGSGTKRVADFQLNGTSVLNVDTGGTVSSNGSFKGSAFTGNGNIAITLQDRSFSSAITAASIGTGTYSASSGTQNVAAITPTYNQTSAAAATDLLIKRTETAVGSGAQYFINCLGGASGVTQNFSVSRTGAGVFADVVSITGVGTGNVISLTAQSNPGSTGASQFNAVAINNQFGAGNFKNQFVLQSAGTGKWAFGNDFNGAGVQNFYIFDSVASLARQFIDASGNVGFGTNSPSAKLHVASTVAGTVGQVIRGFTSQSGDLFQLQDVNANILTKFDSASNFTGFGTNWTQSNLAVPSTPVITNGGTAGSTSYSYTVTAVNAQGETVASTAGSTTTGNATLTGTNTNIVTWTAVSGATSYNVYRTVGGATQGKIFTGITLLTTTDIGGAASGSSPTTTTGTGQTIKLWTSQTLNPVQILDANSAILARINTSGGFCSAVTSGSFTANANDQSLSVQHRNFTTANTALSLLSGGTYTNSTGTMIGVQIAPTINQTNNAATVVLDIDPTLTAVGSGSQILQQWRTGGGSALAKIDTTGLLTTTGLTVTGTATISGTGAGSTNLNLNSAGAHSVQLAVGGSASVGTISFYDGTANVTPFNIDQANSRLTIPSGYQFGFSSNSSFATVAPDTGFSRSSAGVVQVTNGSTGTGAILANNLDTVFAYATGINAKTVAGTLAYTAPASNAVVITRAEVICTAASGVTNGPTVAIGTTSGGTDIFPATAINGLVNTTTANLFHFNPSGMSVTVPAGGTVYVNVTAAATGTSQTVATKIVGYLI